MSPDHVALEILLGEGEAGTAPEPTKGQKYKQAVDAMGHLAELRNNKHFVWLLGEFGRMEREARYAALTGPAGEFPARQREWKTAQRYADIFRVLRDKYRGQAKANNPGNTDDSRTY